MQVISDLPVGGVERLMLDVLPRLLDRYDIQVCCIRARGALAPEFERAGIPVAVKYFRSRWDPLGLYSLASYIRQQRIDIVHTQMYTSNVSGVVAARLARVPAVVSEVHVDHWSGWRQRWMDEALDRFRDRMVVVSKTVRDGYVKATRMDPQKCMVIYNGIDLGQFTKPIAKAKAKARRRWGIKDEEKAVGMIARLVPHKDHTCLIRAAKLVLEKLPQTKFFAVGKEEVSGLLNQLQGQVAELGLEGKFIFTGLVSEEEKLQLLAAWDLFVLPSRREGFGIVLVEAMACGLPVVATPVGGVPEVIADGETGFLFPIGDHKALAEAVFKILTNPELASAMSRASLKRAKLFSIENTVRQTDQLYRELLAEKEK